MRSIFIAVVILSSVIWGVSCNAGYVASIQPILQRSAALDDDFHKIVSFDGTSGASISEEKELPSGLKSESEELSRSLVSIIPPDNYKKAHRALLTAFSTRTKMLARYEDYLNHSILIDWRGAQNHMNNALEYMEKGDDAKSKKEEREAYEITVENAKWIRCAIEDLDVCDEAIREYLTTLQTVSTGLGIDILSNIKESDLSHDEEAMAKLKEITEKNLATHERHCSGCT